MTLTILPRADQKAVALLFDLPLVLPATFRDFFVAGHGHSRPSFNQVFYGSYRQITMGEFWFATKSRVCEIPSLRRHQQVVVLVACSMSHPATRWLHAVEFQFARAQCKVLAQLELGCRARHDKASSYIADSCLTWPRATGLEVDCSCAVLQFHFPARVATLNTTDFGLFS